MDALTLLTDFFKRDTEENANVYEAVAEACCQRKGAVAFFPVQWLRERVQECGGELAAGNHFAVRLVEAFSGCVEIEPGGIRSGQGVPPPVQRRMATQVRSSDKLLSAVLLRRDSEGVWLRRLSPRKRAEPGHSAYEQLRGLKFLLQKSQKKCSDMQRCAP